MQSSKVGLILLSLFGNSLAYASCDLWLNSSIGFESGSANVTRYDARFQRYRTQKLPMAEIGSSQYSFSMYGKDFSCSTGIYHGNQLFSLGIAPFCVKGISSGDLDSTKNGEYYTQKCNNDFSIDVFKKYDDSLLTVSLVPNGYHVIELSSYIVEKTESSTIAFRLKNLQLPVVENFNNANETKLIDGYYRFTGGYAYQSLLYPSAKVGAVEVFLAAGDRYTKLGSCAINVPKKNSLAIKCVTNKNSYNYQVLSQYNTISVLDPHSDN